MSAKFSPKNAFAYILGPGGKVEVTAYAAATDGGVSATLKYGNGGINPEPQTVYLDIVVESGPGPQVLTTIKASGLFDAGDDKTQVRLDQGEPIPIHRLNL